MFPDEVNQVRALPLLPEIDASYPPKLLRPALSMGPPVAPLALHPSSMTPAQPYTQNIPTSNFHLPSPPTCTSPPNLFLPGRGVLPLLQLPFDPIKATPVPFYFHGCASNPVPIVSSLAAGHGTPVLASPLLLTPDNKIHTTPDGLERLKQALFLAGQGGHAPGRGGNPLAGGSLNMLGYAGPFLYRPAERRTAARDGRGAVDPGRVVDRKGKAPMDQPFSPGPSLELSQPDQSQHQERQARLLLLSDSESDHAEPPGKMTKRGMVTYQRRSERIRKLQDGARVGSVERASQRKASSDEGSGQSLGSSSTRRRKTRRIPDINKIAPMPISEAPAGCSRQTLLDLASCCGILNVDQVLKNKGKEAAPESNGSHG